MDSILSIRLNADKRVSRKAALLLFDKVLSENRVINNYGGGIWKVKKENKKSSMH
jgi:hypothetical protein